MNQPLPKKEDNNGYVISYLTLRKAVGILGIALPIVLIAGFALLNPESRLPPSISHYYYTNMGSFFTGTLCAIALFLFAYNGPEVQDKRAATFACVCALGVVFCPTNTVLGVNGTVCPRVNLAANAVRNGFHFGFATLLFLTLAYFSLFLFTKTTGIQPTREKIKRNRIYKVCGWIIIVSVACIAILGIGPFVGLNFAQNLDKLIFAIEALALIAFGFSWLVKGETFLKDKVKSNYT
jgi:hypothetical protein